MQVLFYISKVSEIYCFCYDLRLSLGCNLGKDLSKRIEISQLVKHKDIGLYLQLYIPIDNEVEAW